MMEINDPDYVLKILSKAEERSCSNVQVFIPAELPKKKGTFSLSLRAKIIAYILAGATFITIFGIKIKDAKDSNIVNDYLNTISMPLYDSIHIGEINPSTNSPYWWYDLDSAVDGFKQSGNDIDMEIYASYVKIYPYNHDEHLNELVSKLTDHKYKDFDDYLHARGFESIEQYERIMNELALSSAKALEESEKSSTRMA